VASEDLERPDRLQRHGVERSAERPEDLHDENGLAVRSNVGAARA
jgi:hypothetical protein